MIYLELILNRNTMEELLKLLQDKHGLSLEQSKGIMSTITSYIKEKFPMVAGAVDNLFPDSGSASSDSEKEGEKENLFDKISNAVPGSAAEKLEEFAKDGMGRIFGKK